MGGTLESFTPGESIAEISSTPAFQRETYKNSEGIWKDSNVSLVRCLK